ncbi:MAG: transcriptional regulator [Gammaproteobacteria bacterium RBG_16_51_14]|nr:MAG: transcriptional regulator [Gammaproteobacteria bacterium RBG_16_51_14]
MQLPPDTFFQALSDTTRLRCLLLLKQETELCVCEFTHALSLIQPKVSRHLAMLRESSIVSDRRMGQWIYYRLHPDLPEWALAVLTAAFEGSADTEPFITDRTNLKTMPNRPEDRCCA